MMHNALFGLGSGSFGNHRTFIGAGVDLAIVHWSSGAAVSQRLCGGTCVLIVCMFRFYSDGYATPSHRHSLCSLLRYIAGHFSGVSRCY
jgi:hypothetical protein